MRSCGRCAFFTKLHSMQGNSGLCDRFDARTDADNGHKCRAFRPLKFERKREPIPDHNSPPPIAPQHEIGE